MKKVILFATILVFTSFNLTAATKKDKIIQLFGLMNSDKMINSMVDNMSKMFQNQTSELKNARKDSIQKVYMEYVMDETKAFSKNLINNDMVIIYDKYFTENEVDKYIEFYQTPEGKKLLDQ